MPNNIERSVDFLAATEKPGAAWVEGIVGRFCRDNKLPDVSVKWQGESNDLFVTLSLQTICGKKVSKTFSKHELSSCQGDAGLQQRLTERIAHLLQFLHPEKPRRRL